MAYTVDVDVDHAQCSALLLDRVTSIGNKVQGVARRRAPRKTGKMAASIHVTVLASPGFVYADITAGTTYAVWRHEGTGVFAGRPPLTPKRGRYMRFQRTRNIGPLLPQGGFRRGPRKPSAVVYARSVRGQPGSPFLVSAITDVCGADANIVRFKI